MSVRQPADVGREDTGEGVLSPRASKPAATPCRWEEVEWIPGAGELRGLGHKVADMERDWRELGD